MQGGGRWTRKDWPWKSPPGGVVEGQQGAPQYTKLALCEISGHPEGPTAVFSQSEPVCFLKASEPEPVRRAACWQCWRLCWVAPFGEKGGLLQGGPRGSPTFALSFTIFVYLTDPPPDVFAV